MNTNNFHNYPKSTTSPLPSPGKDLAKLMELISQPLPTNFHTFTDEDLEAYIESVYKKEHGVD